MAKRLASLLALKIVLLHASCLFGQETVRLSADSWMPYNGDPAAELPGYVVDFAREIFEPKGINVDYANHPWDETLAAARKGEIDGAICANKEEGEGLILPSESVGAPKMVIITRKDSAWKYESVLSFKTIKLGVIADYSYWEFLDKYLEKAEPSSVFVSQSENPLDELFAKLDSGEIDALIDSESVIIWKLREEEKSRDAYRTAYRHVADPVYIAFAPTENGKRFASIFNEGMKSLAASGRKTEILARYGLHDWR